MGYYIVGAESLLAPPNIESKMRPIRRQGGARRPIRRHRSAQTTIWAAMNGGRLLRAKLLDDSYGERDLWPRKAQALSVNIITTDSLWSRTEKNTYRTE